MIGNLIKKQPYEPGMQDVLVTFSSDGTADISPVIDITEERVLAVSGEVEQAVPIGDLKVYIGRRGRIFCYAASIENITDTKRLATLEKSIVLRQITMFEKEGSVIEQGKLPVGKMILVAAIILVVIIVLAVK